MGRITKFAAGPRTKWLVIAAWVLLAVALAPLQPKLQAEAADESDAFQAASAESTRAGDLVEQRFGEGAEVSTVIAYTRAGGLTAADTERIKAEATSLCESRTIPSLVRVITPFGLACGDLSASIAPSSPAVGPIAQDNTTALVTVQSTDDATDAVVADVATIRQLVPDPDADGLRAYVTGETAFAADQSASFEGIDETLLAITAVLILVLLLAVYRSPVAAAVPLVIVSIAYVVAAGGIYGLSAAGLVDPTGQATAILIVLMFGAGTDYCLLIVSRYKEELRRGLDAATALRVAAERSAPAILSAGGIVVAAMLVLTLADYRATASMGPILAAGTAVTLLAGLTLLPALLAALGPRAFWPVAPKPAASDTVGGVWERVGAIVRARPWPTIAVVTLLLGAGALGALDSRGVLAFADNFRDPPESVQAQRLIEEKYPPGVLGPADAVVASGASGVVVEQLDQAPGVLAAQATSLSKDRELTLVEITLDEDPFSEAAIDRVPALRDALRTGAGGELALLGGPTAESFDSRAALRADAKLIVPIVLVLILLIVAALVRAIVAPLYLVATVVLSYAFALGASSLFFTHVLGQPDSDPALPMFAFVFLVALGVDYNIFLITRIREERARHGPRDAVIAGLERSGSVITSAGLILAGTFCTLIALDVVGLAQVGFTVAFGLLVDTFIVRCFLVPAIAVVLGEHSWWPGRTVGAAAKVAACALLTLVLLGSVRTPDARAETYTVRTLADGGPGSLRAALAAAQAGPGADELVVTARGTIMLRTQLPDLNSALVIRGPGAGALALARAGAAEHPFRPITVGPGGDVELHGMTLRDGVVAERSAPRGGGVLNAGRLVLDGVVVADSEVRGEIGVAGGGGVANSGTLELRRSELRGNRAVATAGSAGGGGVHNVGDLLVLDTVVRDNARTEMSASPGAAGIEHAAGRATVRGATVVANAGTGIHNGFSDLVVESSTVAGNAAAVTAIGGQTLVRDSTLSGGAPNLAGLRVDIPSTITVAGTTFAGGAPNCVMTAQVEAISLGGNVADDASCTFFGPADRVGDAAAPPQPAPIHPGPVHVAPRQGSPPQSEPLRIDAVQRRGDGTARVRLSVTRGGRVVLAGRGVRRSARQAAGARSLTLRVRPQGRAARRLARHGSTRVRARITFAPASGTTEMRRFSVRLRMRR